MSELKNRPIGIFDSGIGGLTVFREIEKLLPGEHLIYFGDTARVPYGTKSAETVKRYSLQIARFLQKKHIKMLVVACNTASAFSIPLLQRKFSFPVSGVIVAGVQGALRRTKNGRIAVIGTPGTINSGSYRKALLKSFSLTRKKIRIQYTGKACPLFVPLVEEGWTHGQITMQIARKYLRFVNQRRCDTLILGCTHYPLLKNVIRKVVGGRVAIVDSGEQTAVIIRGILTALSLLREGSNLKGKREFFVTDSPEKFRAVGQKFLKKKMHRIKQIHVD